MGSEISFHQSPPALDCLTGGYLLTQIDLFNGCKMVVCVCVLMAGLYAHWSVSGCLKLTSQSVVGIKSS